MRVSPCGPVAFLRALSPVHPLVLKYLTLWSGFNSQDGNTALHIACTQGHHQMCQLLLDRGADILTKNQVGKVLCKETYLWNCMVMISRERFGVTPCPNFIELLSTQIC